jgi:peptide/nickel transport system substrate-binding protein
MFKRTTHWMVLLVVLAVAACGGGGQGASASPGATATGAPASAAVTLAASPGATATGAPASAAATPAGSGGDATLHVGWSGKPDTLNPAYAFQSESYTVFHLVYSTLTTQAADGSYVGSLARDWSVSGDGLTWTYHLKSGITWHNGEPFSADQMAWAINDIMKNPEGWATLANYAAGFANVTAPDPATVVIVTEYPIANMDYRTSFLYAFYPPDFEKFTKAEDLQNFSNPDAIGTGPFKLKTFDGDAGIVLLDANKDFVDGAPKVGGIVFQTFDNTDAMVQALKVGEIDMLTSVPASAYASVKGFDNTKTIASPDTYFYELIINDVDPKNDPAPTGNPALADPAVRLALAHAINREDIVDIVMQGLAVPGDTIIGPAMGGGFWHNPNVKGIPFDTAEAARVLDAAGYAPGADGVRAKGDLRLEFRLQFPTTLSAYSRIADMMVGWFKEAGIKVNPETMSEDGLVAATTPAGDYDLVLWSWEPDPDPDFILSVLTTDQFVDGGWSDSGYHNPEYDKLYLEQQRLVDRTARQQVIWRMQELAFNERPYIVLDYEDKLQAYRSDRFTGFIESPLGIESMQSLLSVEPVK